MKVVTSEQMRRIDAVTINERGIAGAELMERAGRAVAGEVWERFAPASVAIVTGRGNNAGDGFVIARELAARGARVQLLMLAPADALRGDALGAYQRVPENVARVVEPSAEALAAALGACDVAIDAILGTGTQGEVRDPAAAAIAALNAAEANVVAVDIPSGLPGEPPRPGEEWGPCVRAGLTVTIGRPKLSMVVEPGVAFTGRVVVADIGFPGDLLDDAAITTDLVTRAEARALLPSRPAAGHKGAFGRVMILGGCEGMTGAAVMAARAAARSGAGLIYAAYPRPLTTIMESHLVEPVKLPLAAEHAWFGPGQIDPVLEAAEKMDAVAVGPGLGTHLDTRVFVHEIVRGIRAPLVIDADGLNLLCGATELLGARSGGTILTPHPGEAARLLGKTVEEIEGDRLGAFIEFAARHGVVTLLKGAQSVITDPDGRRFINPSGNTGLSKGGSGDVLTGLLAGLMAQGMGGVDAARLGVFFHGFVADMLARRMSVRGMLAGDIVEAMGEAWRALEREEE